MCRRPRPAPSISAASSLEPSPTPSRPYISILPATPNDFRTIGLLQRRAFAPSAIARHIFADVSESDYLSQWTTRMGKALKHPYKEIFKAVDEAGGIVGAALWETPKPVGYKEEEEERVWAPGTNIELAKALFGQLGAFGTGDVPQYRTSLSPLSLTLGR
jgi:hypothetical protein